MSYQVPQHIDPNKVFLINHSELEGRLDSMFYTHQFSDIIVALKKCSLYKRLGQIAHFSSESWNQRDYYEKHFPYIEIGAINITDGKIEDVNIVPIEQAPSRAKMIVRTNDILISTTRPNRGAIVKITEKENLYIASTGFAVIRDIDDSVNRDYLLTVLRLDFTLKQMLQRSTGGNYPAITDDELSKIIIPIPPIGVQNKIVSLIESAHKRKQNADFMADSLLQSIDDYLLGELGIERPSPTRTENGRFFYTSYKEVIGRRLDPLAYSGKAKEIKQSIGNGKYPCTTLKSLIIQESAGDWGIDVVNDFDEHIYSKCLVLRSTEFNLYHNIVIDSTKAKYRLISNKKLDSIDLQPNDLIIEKSGGSENQPVGRIAIITKDLYERDRLCYSNFVQKIRLDNSQVIPTYACFFLRLVHNMRLTETMQSQTNGIRNLILSEYYNQQIPIPPIEKQKEIIYHIGTLYNRAKQLQHEATTILSDAKQEIEQMILG